MNKLQREIKKAVETCNNAQCTDEQTQLITTRKHNGQNYYFVVSKVFNIFCISIYRYNGIGWRQYFTIPKTRDGVRYLCNGCNIKLAPSVYNSLLAQALRIEKELQKIVTSDYIYNNKTMED